MRLAVVLALVIACGAPAAAQLSPSPSPLPGVAACAAQQALLGAAGRAGSVAFTSATFRTRVCVVYANLALDVVARLGSAVPDDALVVAALTNGSGASLTLQGDTPNVTAAAATADAFGVGPFVIAPGGVLPNFGGDTSEVPRVVLGYAGPRMVVMQTGPVTLRDLARALREQPDLFGADAFERAVVIASGPQAALHVRGTTATLGTPPTTAQTLSFISRR